MDVASVRADSRVVELLGREDELARLYDLIDGIDARGGALLVRGEAGIGKSALLAAAQERAARRGVTVLSTAGALWRRSSPSRARTNCCFRCSAVWISFLTRSSFGRAARAPASYARALLLPRSRRHD